MAETFWLKATVAQRKKQYTVLKQLADTTGQTLGDIWKAALGIRPQDDSAFWDNPRSGRLCRKKCARLQAWIRQHYPEFAARLDREVGIVLEERAPAPPLQPVLYRMQISHSHYGPEVSCSTCNPQSRKSTRPLMRWSARQMTADPDLDGFR